MKLAVFFPGIGYHCDKPLLYYSRKLVQEYGYEKIVTLNYTYDGKNLRGNEEKMRQAFDSLYIQAENSLKEIAFDQYEQILFISKSIGTIIASAYAEAQRIPCRHILYTPLEETYAFSRSFGKTECKDTHIRRCKSFTGDQKCQRQSGYLERCNGKNKQIYGGIKI